MFSPTPVFLYSGHWYCGLNLKPNGVTGIICQGEGKWIPWAVLGAKYNLHTLVGYLLVLHFPTNPGTDLQSFCTILTENPN